MQKKRIVILIDWYLPGNKAGGPVKSIYSLVSILRDYFDFYIITTNTDLGSASAYTGITPNTWSKHNDIPVYYFSKDNLNKDSLAEAINGIKPDVVYLNSFWSYFFSILPLRLKKQGKIGGRIVLAPRGMLGKGAMSLKSLKKNLFLFFSKLTGLHTGITFHASTPNEEKEIRQFFTDAKILTASNMNAMPVIKNREIPKQPGELKLLFLSRVARVKNLHFALETLLELKTGGKISYTIFGSMEDKDYWNECEALIKKLPKNISVTYKGELSFENVQVIINDHHFLYLPTLNENFGHTIAECLLSACPVIISDRTPWNAINEAGCGRAISLEDKPAFINALNDALDMNDATYKRMSENCSKFIDQKIDLRQTTEAYLKLFA